MSNWYERVTDYILNNLTEYATDILNATSIKGSKSIHLNPCPFCGHNDALTLTKGFNGGNCFSCEESGSLIELAEKVHGQTNGRKLLADFSGIEYVPTAHNPKEQAEKDKRQRFVNMAQDAVAFYHFALMANRPVTDSSGQTMSPYEFQTEIRKHNKETLKKFQVGYSIGGDELFNYLKDKGHDPAEIKEANKKLLWIPRGYFVYPYFDEHGALIRLNAKAFVRHCRGREKPTGGFHDDCDYTTFDLQKETQETHEKGFRHTMNATNFSRGSKESVFFRDPRDLKKKKKRLLILVEGENDVASTHELVEELPESYKKSIMIEGIGGNVSEQLFKSEHLRSFDTIYEAFDNDEAGEKYHDMLNRMAPEIPLKKIRFPESSKDIDEFKVTEPNAAESFKEMFDEAEPIETKHFRVYREGLKHSWSIQNRHVKLTYDIDYYKQSKKGFEGTLLIYLNNVFSNKKIGNIDTINVSGHEVTRLKLELSNTIDDYYHQIRWIKDEPQRSFNDLVDIVRLTKDKEAVFKQIAWYIFHAGEGDARLPYINELKKKVRDEQFVAHVLKEVNGFDNEEIDPNQDFPRMQISQSMYPKNGDAYMYFAKFVKDGDTLKRVPCLVSNKKEEIRLDLLKRKDPQSLLLVNNRYELPIEIETNIVQDVSSLSLQHSYVNRWISGEIKSDDVLPSTIIKEMESFIRSVYYTSDDIIKVLSLWIYATHFYSLFKSGFPYLVFTGAKGTGKSTIDAIINLLAFNPKFSVNTTEAALFRAISLFGGTFILDEVENMSDSNKVNDSGTAAVIKAGYADAGKILRVNNDTGMVEEFSAFGPKVISNISGVEAVIADRCIFIETFAASFDQTKDLIDPQIFIGERRSELHSVSSRAAISALENFQEVESIFRENTRMNTGNARLTQLMRPLITMARLVGGDYEDALMRFYTEVVREAKEETNRDTLEGKIKHILISVSEEVLGLTHRRFYLAGQSHYDKAIDVDYKTKTFQMDSLHFKVLAEEMDEEKDYSLKQIHTAVKHVMGKGFEFKNNSMATKLVVDDEDLLRRMKNKKYVHGHRIKFNARKFIPPEVEHVKYSASNNDGEELF